MNCARPPGTGEQFGVQRGGAGMVLGRAGPLDPFILDALIADAAIDRNKGGDLIHDLGRMGVGHRIAHQGRNLADDLPVGQAGDGFDRFSDPLNPALAVGEGPVLFCKTGAWQDHIGVFCRLGREDILNNQELDFVQGLAHMVEIGSVWAGSSPKM